MPFRRVIPLALIVLVASCDDAATAPIEPTPPPPPEAAVWHLTLSDGQAPPALVAHRLVQGSLEQVFADSAQLTIGAAGQWTLTSWLRTYRGGQPYLASVQTEHGTWAWQDTAYVFISDDAHSRGWMREPTAAAQTFWLRYVGVEGIAVSTFRRERPPASIFGEWHATAAAGEPLPRVFTVTNSYLEDGVLKSIHAIVDSARIRLHPTGQYTHRVWYSEWEGVPDGPPVSKRTNWYHGDFGYFVRQGTAVSTESNWLQNHRMTGTLEGPDHPLQLTHPFSAGETPVPYLYVR